MLRYAIHGEEILWNCLFYVLTPIADDQKFVCIFLIVSYRFIVFYLCEAYAFILYFTCSLAVLEMDNLWQIGNEFRGHSKVTEDHQWLAMTSKLAELTRINREPMNNLDYPKNSVEAKSWDKQGFQEDNKFENLNLGLMNLDLKMNDIPVKGSFRNGMYNMNMMYQKSNANSFNNFKMNSGIHKYANINSPKDINNNSNGTNTNNGGGSSSNNNNNNNNVADKRFKTLPLTEMLPRNEVLGGYIFVCNNDTMQEDLKRQLFGISSLPSVFYAYL